MFGKGGCVVVLQDSPQRTTWLNHVLQLNNVPEDFGNVAACVVEQSAAEKELDDVVAGDFLVVVEQDVVRYIGLSQMR